MINNEDEFLFSFLAEVNENRIEAEDAAQILTNYTLNLLDADEGLISTNARNETAPTMFSTTGPVAQSTVVGGPQVNIESTNLEPIAESSESEFDNNQM